MTGLSSHIPAASRRDVIQFHIPSLNVTGSVLLAYLVSALIQLGKLVVLGHEVHLYVPEGGACICPIDTQATAAYMDESNYCYANIAIYPLRRNHSLQSDRRKLSGTLGLIVLGGLDGISVW